jgi:hypothetical protein
MLRFLHHTGKVGRQLRWGNGVNRRYDVIGSKYGGWLVGIPPLSVYHNCYLISRGFGAFNEAVVSLFTSIHLFKRESTLFFAHHFARLIKLAS